MKHTNLYFFLICIIFLSALICINTVQAEKLIFTEIMYNPEGSDIDNEWLEIFNNSTSSITINENWRFNDGSNHHLNLKQGDNNIEVNEFVLLVADIENFTNNYNFSGTIYETAMNLSNSGEEISLLDNSNLITSFDYDPQIGADGNNKTLERIDFNLNDWQESFVVKGTPGDYSSIFPANTPPTAIITAAENIFINEETIFDASASFDPDGNSLSYLWNFANQASSSLKIAQHTFTESGNFEISLTIDDGLASSTDSLLINVLENEINPIEIIITNLADEFLVGEIIHFNACQSNGENLEFHWDLGDGGQGNSCVLDYRYNSTGIYNIILEVSNENNNLSKNLELMIKNNSNNIIINELLPNPEGSDDYEWLELKNIDQHDINLKNWKISDASGKEYIFSDNNFSDLILSTSEFLVLEREISGISLNNSNESIYLFDNLGEEVFNISYGNSQENYSYAYFDDGWQWTSILTKGSKNQRIDLKNPQAIIKILSTELFTDQEIIFSAIDSENPQEQNLEYKWYFDNSIKSSTEELKITFSNDGLKKIKLIVKNENNLEGEAIIYLNILEKLTANQKSEEENNLDCQDYQKEIIISEILPNPVGSDDAEFIELYNPNNFEINLKIGN
ncbi:lamin tail domain-containing protein [bacterium]|nr:lamin tail domain-containing protein [bacterium]